MPVDIKAFFDPATYTVSYLVSDSATKRGVIIDPVLDFDPKSGRIGTASAEKILAAVATGGFAIDWILETHAHADHLSAAKFLKEKSGAPVVIGANITMVQKTFRPVFHADDLACDGAPFDRLVQDGETIAFGSQSIEVLHTPGHTPACVSYKIGENLFVGDTLFMPDYGTARCDFPGGDARTLYRSIGRILSLPPQTVLWMCHDYGSPERQEFAWKTTVGEERETNVHIRDGISEDGFVAMREQRDATLAMPELILASVQVNIRAGHMPPPESDGNVYLKLPVNRL